MLKFFNKIKENLFKNIKKEKQQTSLQINDLDDFLNKTSSEIQVVLDEDINKIYSGLIETIRVAKENISNLEKAKLMNDKIGIKEKQIMEGNREEYIRKVNKYVDSVNTISRGCLGAQDLVKSNAVSFEELNKSITRNFIVMQEFFANESTAVAKKMKEIYLAIQEFQSLIEQSKINHLFNTRDLYATLKSNYNKIQDFDKTIDDKKAELEKIRINREDIEKKIIISKNHEEFKKFSSLVEQRDEANNKLKTMELTFSQQFSQLDRPLRKLQRNSIHEKVIQEYLENSVTAAARDKQLKILLVFDELKTELIKNTIELKDKQKEKTIDVIKSMDKDFFENFAKEYQTIKHDKIEKDHLINVNQVMRDYNELDYKLQHLIMKSSRVIEEINQLEVIKNRLNNEELEKELVKEINKFKTIDIIFFKKKEFQNDLQGSSSASSVSSSTEDKIEEVTSKDKIENQQPEMARNEAIIK
ncbi:hypothetical protein HZA96_02095 [Candidatus Woesearchaeota archaeon]|nr:hypothetical protein [Candidatus Woesearchaeota archaeon]